MSKPIDLQGIKFGKLKVLERAKSNKWGQAQWLCQCDCKEYLIATGKQLRKGYVTCCRVCAGSKNEYDLSLDYGVCYLSNNKEFYFDLKDYDIIKTKHWRLDSKGYVVSGGSGEIIYLHRMLLNFPNNHIDHINHKTYDNRKSNLRIATSSENAMNRKIQKNNKSGFAGVYWSKSRNKWLSTIKVNGTKTTLGQFSDKEGAIEARLEAELKYFGEFRNKDF